jgi:ribosomal protein uL24
VSGSPHSPRRQRKAHFTARPFRRRLQMAVPLSRELRRRFHRRSVPVRKGDTVRVLSGSYEGREERVARVVRRDFALVLDNVTLKSGEEKLKPLPLKTNHLVITRLNLADAWRRRALRVADEDVTAEERGETPEEPEAAAPAPAALSGAAPPPAAEEPEAAAPAEEDGDA